MATASIHKAKSDRHSVKALLIGISKYKNDTSLSSIPNVKKNIKLLEKALLSNYALHINKKDITISLNENKTDIERRLMQAATEAKNHNYTLLVYYSGHGIISTQNFNLYLSAGDTTNNYLEADGIHVDRFSEIIEGSRAGKKIVIVDSCYSGAVHYSMRKVISKSKRQFNSIENTYVVSSTSKDNTARYPVGNKELPTCFTAKLIDIIYNGINNNKATLTIHDICREIKRALRNSEDIPSPQYSSFDNARGIIFAKNNIDNKNIPQSSSQCPYNVLHSNKKQKSNFFNRAVSALK